MCKKIAFVNRLKSMSKVVFNIDAMPQNMIYRYKFQRVNFKCIKEEKKT